MVFLDDVQNVLADVFRASKNRLHTTAIPIQKLFLEHILNVVHHSRVQFARDILGGDFLKRGVNVQPPKQIVANNMSIAHDIFVCQILTPRKIKRGQADYAV